ncbi:MAG: hypothetical protein JXA92_03980 [candidate division Zixibacteria bacterium]|nr:hypothetical protein [candidate division Zixibacteria bacterium]
MDLPEEQKTPSAVPPIEGPSKEALNRYALIPLCHRPTAGGEVLHGKVAYDSWAHGSPVALRDTTDGFIRRLQLKAKKISLEIVAERRQNSWQFVARVYSGEKVLHDFVLKVGREKLLPFSGGFYQWSSPKVPATVKLLSYERKIVFDRISWR